MSMSYVGFGFIYANRSQDARAVVLKKFAPSYWGAFSISATDLLALVDAQERPRLESALLIAVGRTRSECLHAIGTSSAAM